MKTLNQFITESIFRSGERRAGIGEVMAADKEELKEMIEQMIKRFGNKCNLNSIDTSNITDMSGLFEGSSFNGDISEWDVSSVTNMTHMFDSSKFNGDISKWDVSAVNDMTGMFYRSKFNGDISDWDVSRVRYMTSMFEGSKFNGDISKWSAPKLRSTDYMFDDCPLTKKYEHTPDVIDGHILTKEEKYN